MRGFPNTKTQEGNKEAKARVWDNNVGIMSGRDRNVEGMRAWVGIT